MTIINRDYVDGITIFDTFSYLLSPNRTTKDIVDEISFSDVLTELHTEHYDRTFTESVAFSDVLTYVLNNNFIKNIEDIIFIADIAESIKREAPILNLSDIINISDLTTSGLNDQFSVTLSDIINLSDIFTELHTLHYDKIPLETAVVTDEVLIFYGIIVVGGTGSGNEYSIGEVVQLGVNAPDGKVFFRWNFSKVGITNIYDPNSTLIMPQGGGVITAEFIDLQTINDIVIIYDVFDYEFIDNAGVENDEILTNRTATPAGGDMGVANHDFELLQGARFHNIIVYKDNDGNPVDLTGYTAEMQIRKYKEADDPTLLTITTDDSTLALGGNQGTITIDVPASTTDDLDFKWGFYDLELYPANDKDNAIRILEGRIELSKQVTR